ncbi:MAG: penicillin-binding protein 2 [Alphaproteobacteria bacterium]
MDSREIQRANTFTRRSALVSLGGLTAFGALFSRLYSLQVVNSQYYDEQAWEVRVQRRLIPPPRGRILDRFGVELATTRRNYQVLLVPEDAPDVDGTLDKLAKLVEITPEARERIKRDIRRNPSFVPVKVVENLTWQEFARINVHAPELPGIQPGLGETRHYPYGAGLAHSVGYVGAVNERDLEEYGRDRKLRAVLKLPGARIGKNGVELTIEDKLRGEAGVSWVEVNARGRVVQELQRNNPKPGDISVLTVDMEVQKLAIDLLKEKSGSVVVMDVHTGELVAFVSYPAPDPNDFNMGMPSSTWKELSSSEYKPLVNKALRGQYPPGSTFKVLVALAALTHERMKPDETVYCGQRIWVGNHAFHCWKEGGHGRMNMHDGIKNSCDIYFYKLAERTGIENITEMARRFGLGQTYDFELPGEKSGLVPTLAWRRSVNKKYWSLGETLNIGIGQGQLLATPMQLAVMTSRIANGGYEVKPRLIRSVGGVPFHPPIVKHNLNVNEDHVQFVREAMNAVTKWGGTAGRAGQLLKDLGLSMAGKTGTAQVRRISKEERAAGVLKNEELPWRLRDHALFVGYGPVENPKYAVSVVVEHGGGGSKTAAPIAAEVLALTLQRDPSSRPVYVPPEEPVRSASNIDPGRG